MNRTADSECCLVKLQQTNINQKYSHCDKMETNTNPRHQRTRLKRSKRGITSYYSTMLSAVTTSNVILYLALLLLPNASADYVKNFKIRESVPIGTRIGYIGTPVPGQPRPPGPPYLVVPSADSPIAEDLDVDQNTGEIRTKIVLDRESRDKYRLSAIPLTEEGETIKVTIEVEDENDNRPTFPSPRFSVELPENAPKDTKRRLPSAIDKDLGIFNTQRYIITSGNVGNAFRLSTRNKDGVLSLDLIVNGYLDRETVDGYNLVIEAQDGGNPPKTGVLTVDVNIQDLNDNAPMFSEQRYFTAVPENATVGTKIITVTAVDPDQGSNGAVTYSINRRQSDGQELFRIDSLSGLLSVNKRLDFESRDSHELVVVARDNGQVPQESTAFITVKITDINDNQPKIDIEYKTANGRPEIYEDANVGQKIADINVKDPDQLVSALMSDFDVSISGQGADSFSLERNPRGGYSVVLVKGLDRETTEVYRLRLEARNRKPGSGGQQAELDVELRILDVNDNSPEFALEEYTGVLAEEARVGTSVLTVHAMDRDTADNARISYRIDNLAGSHSDWFQVDPASGLITNRVQVDCETDPEPSFIVIATDNGNPRRSASVTVKIGVQDVNDNEPVFDEMLYNVTLKESEELGNCFMRVHAVDTDCGVASKVAYSFQEAQDQFSIDEDTGDICLSSGLDYERLEAHHVTVIAVDRGGLTATSMVRVNVVDINDNSPTFSPEDYKARLSPDARPGTQVLSVSATDKDSGLFGEITYSIEEGNNEGLFSLDTKTGVISVSRSMQDTRGTFQLSISAEDQGGNKSEKSAVVNIIIQSESSNSENQPIACTQNLFSFAVPENSPSGADIGKISIRNGAGAVKMFIYPEELQNLFLINPQNGFIKTRGRLDYEDRQFYLINIGLETPGGETGFCQAKVQVIDVNDNAPSFGTSQSLVTLAENSPVGTLVFAKQAHDLDSGRNGEVRYRIIKDKGLFSVDEKSGVVTTLVELDYEKAAEHRLQLIAYDLGQPSLSTSLALTIALQDENDHAPELEEKDYQITIEENLPKDSQILTPKARDRDTGKNGRLKFSLIDNTGSGSHFISILPSSGIIYLKQELDYETINHFDFTLKVEDGGSPSLSDEARLRISVTDFNDNPPEFDSLSYKFSVQENTGADYVVGRVEAKDTDSGASGRITYNFKSSTDSFKIDSNTGEIRTVVSLDRESGEYYNVEVEAVDHGIPRLTSTATLNIQVLDENDNAPVIIDPLETYLSVRARSPLGTTVAQLQAIDPDLGQGGALVYSIVDDGEEGYDLFTIDGSTGVIKTDNNLKGGGYNVSLTAQVSDKGSSALSSRVHYNIQIMREKDPRLPFAQTNIIIKVAENATPGSKIGNIKPEDSNLDFTNNGVWYSIQSGNRGGFFDIENWTGNLVVVKPLDSDSSKEFNLKVALNDNIYGIAREVIKVKLMITDVNDNSPLFSRNLVEFSVKEDLEVGTSAAYTVRAKDIDAGGNGSIRYKILDQFPDEYFQMDSLSGELFLLKHLDYESTDKIFMTIRATDSPYEEKGRRTSHVAVIVNVEDINDHAPVFISPDARELQEDTEIGVPFHRILAVDSDTGDAGSLNYGIEGGNLDNTFHLDSVSGLLSLKLSPSRTSYRLVIHAQDGGTPKKSTKQILQLTATKQTDGPPKFVNSVYKANILENSEPGSSVITVRADKQGSTSNFHYSIDSRVSLDLFGINERSGEIVTMSKLDREAQDEYLVTVYVHDSSKSPSFDSATVLIKVLDENDNAPKFIDSCYPLFVPENTDLSALHTFVAVDNDIGANGKITYSITSGDEKNRFSVDAHTGQLSASPLDHEEKSKYVLTIKAEDQGRPQRQSAACDVTIRVTDRNDNDPVFTQSRYRARIMENVAKGSTVTHVEAKDADKGNNAKVSYSIQNGTEWIFGIDKDSGEIYTTGNLDREKNEIYTLVVVAVDEGVEDTRMSTSTVTITLDDENDEQPRFVEYPFMAQILAGHDINEPIVKVRAVDNDKGANAQLKYSFLNNEHADKFSINENNGEISSKVSLEGEDGSMFHLEVVATDGGSPVSLSSTGLVEIRVGQQPGVQLNFQQKVYQADIKEDAKVGADIVQVQAVRSDGRIQRVIYTFGQGNTNNIFEINSNNGLIRLKKPELIDFETVKEHKVTVIGHAAGQDQLYAYADCIINILDINDNEPRFTQMVYFARAWEGNNKGTFVTQVMAVDEDSIENDQLYYQIVDGNHDGAFIIDQQYSGIIKTNIVLDREIRDAYELTVTATDEGSPPKTGYTKVIVKIIDINDNQPQFPQPRPIVVSEGVSPGKRIGTIQANDIDSHPHLTYSYNLIGDNNNINNDGLKPVFNMDKFSGILSLGATPLDREVKDSYKLCVSASDGAHTVHTEVAITVTDQNDNRPRFSKQEYTGTFSRNMSVPAPVASLQAIDPDLGNNGQVHYSLLGSNIGFIDENGTVFINTTEGSQGGGTEIHLVAMAEDLGSPSLKSFVSIRLQNLQHAGTKPQFEQAAYQVVVNPAARIGIQFITLGLPHAQSNLFYSLQTPNPYFAMDSASGALVLKRKIEDVKNVPGSLEASLRRANRQGGETSASINIQFDGLTSLSADGIFQRKYYEINLSENTGVDTQIFNIPGIKDFTSKINLNIAAGNTNDMFQFSQTKPGALILRKPFDFETTQEYKLTVFGSIGLKFDTFNIVIRIIDENDNAPFFPVSRQIHTIKENQPPGSLVFMAYAQDLDITDTLSYTIDNGSQEFKIGENTGRVVSTRTFDYESEKEFRFVLIAADSTGSKATADVTVKVESVDEYHPVFESQSYKFSVDRVYPAGHILGRVKASDEDQGPGGRVVYSLASSDPYFNINPDSGELSVARNLDTGLLLSSSEPTRQYQDVTYVIQASTGRRDSLKTSTLVILQVKTDILPLAPLPSTGAGVAVWGQALIIAIVFIVLIAVAGFFLFRKFSGHGFMSKRLLDPNSTANLQYAGSPGNVTNHHDTSTLDSTVPMSQYPPQYSDIVAQFQHSGKVTGGVGRSANASGGVQRLTQSELSEQSHRSASSGRGSAEEGEEDADHEIRMINGLPGLLNDTCLAEDSMSDISVQNGKEYLARLGIDTSTRVIPPHHLSSHASSYQTLEGQADLYNRLQDTDALSEKNSLVSGANSVYARTGHPTSMTGSLSSIVHSEEEVAGSYNWDYLLDWGPQYQPLQHVFQEISSLKDEGQNAGITSGLEVVPPLLTSLPPKHAHSVVTSQSQWGSPIQSSNHHQEMITSHHSHPHGGVGSALSPSFSPALSPLATRSPSISPVVVGPLTGTPRGPARGVVRGAQHHGPARYGSQATSIHSDYVEAAEKELRI